MEEKLVEKWLDIHNVKDKKMISQKTKQEMTREEKWKEFVSLMVENVRYGKVLKNLTTQIRGKELHFQRVPIIALSLCGKLNEGVHEKFVPLTS